MSDLDQRLEIMDRTQQYLKESCPEMITYTFTRPETIEIPNLVIRTKRWRWVPDWCLRLSLPIVTKQYVSKVNVQFQFCPLDDKAERDG